MTKPVIITAIYSSPIHSATTFYLYDGKAYLSDRSATHSPMIYAQAQSEQAQPERSQDSAD